jgi:GNAT superfamily N-acetyltransferase
VIGDSGDLAALTSLLGYPTTAAEMKRRLEVILADGAHATFVAQADARGVIGMIGVCLGYHYARDGAYGRIVALSVDEPSRGQGIGSALVERAEQWVVSRGGLRILVNTRATRRDAHRFYRGLGYEETGLRFGKEL